MVFTYSYDYPAGMVPTIARFQSVMELLRASESIKCFEFKPGTKEADLIADLLSDQRKLKRASFVDLKFMIYWNYCRFARLVGANVEALNSPSGFLLVGHMTFRKLAFICSLLLKGSLAKQSKSLTKKLKIVRRKALSKCELYKTLSIKRREMMRNDALPSVANIAFCETSYLAWTAYDEKVNHLN